MKENGLTQQQIAQQDFVDNTITKIILGDCKEVLKDLVENSIDLIVTSPPYADSRNGTYGGIEQFDGDYDDRIFINQTGAVSILSTGRFSMVMFTMSRRESFLLASRISMPTICLFSSRSTVIPSSMSMLSSTDASLNCIYKASASLSYSIFNLNHLHPFFFFTAVITKTFFITDMLSQNISADNNPWGQK
jgi:hypothetical protein